ncbi:hypothetical protein AGMMS49921_06850 [Endomicrobiia bacterium]|nr:hypothetical protein AGMMS49921_06850 [Endomicrobiia bacterium]
MSFNADISIDFGVSMNYGKICIQMMKNWGIEYNACDNKNIPMLFLAVKTSYFKSLAIYFIIYYFI